MTTAEFIIGHSADDSEERKQETRKVFVALLVAVVIHLLIGYCLAVYGRLLDSPLSVTEEEKPVELSFVDLSTPAPVKEMPIIQTDKNRETAEALKQPDFQANANSVAASELPPTGRESLPTQDGKNRPWLAFQNQDFIPAEQGSRNAAEVKKEPSTVPLPTVSSRPDSEKFPSIDATPQPSAQASVAAKPARDYQRHETKSRMSGAVSRAGYSSVNAAKTPRGRYQKAAWDIIAQRASMFYASKGDNAAIGSIDATFVIDRTGRIKNLKLTRNTSNETFANIILEAIMDAKLPPIPEDLASTLPPEGLEIDAGFNLIPDDVP